MNGKMTQPNDPKIEAVDDVKNNRCRRRVPKITHMAKITASVARQAGAI